MTRLLDMAYKHKYKQIMVVYVLQHVVANPGLRPKNLLKAMKDSSTYHGVAFDLKHGELVNILYNLLACQLVDDLDVCWEQSERYKVWYPTDNAQVWLQQVTQ